MSRRLFPIPTFLYDSLLPKKFLGIFNGRIALQNGGKRIEKRNFLVIGQRNSNPVAPTEVRRSAVGRLRSFSKFKSIAARFVVIGKGVIEIGGNPDGRLP